MHTTTEDQCYWPFIVLWSYYDCVVLHQAVFDCHCHTQIRSSQRPQHTDRRREQRWYYINIYTHMLFRAQLSVLYLVYFWILISFGMDKGRMMTRHIMKRANRWSVYQWYGISPSTDPVTVSYRETDTGKTKVESKRKVSSPTLVSKSTKDSFTLCILPAVFFFFFSLKCEIKVVILVDKCAV